MIRSKKREAISKMLRHTPDKVKLEKMAGNKPPRVLTSCRWCFQED